MPLLSVNVNKIALLRNARGHDEPNVLRFSQDLINCGAQGITVHPRPDERHIKYSDCYELKKHINVELNIEGYPTEDFLAMVCELQPAQCTLVPDPPEALTSSAGWDCRANMVFLQGVCARLKAAGVRVSIFLDADPSQVEFAAQTGTDRIELYTEDYATSYGTADFEAIYASYKITAELAAARDLGINAGHDLNQSNLSYLSKNMPDLLEVSIGHALIGEMLYEGMQKTIAGYLDCLS